MFYYSNKAHICSSHLQYFSMYYHTCYTKVISKTYSMRVRHVATSNEYYAYVACSPAPRVKAMEPSKDIFPIIFGAKPA